MRKIKPSVPIIFKKFPYCPGYVKTEDDRKCKFFYLNDPNLQLYIPQDDTLLLDLENTEHKNYKILLYRHKPGFKNISNFTNVNSILVDEILIKNNPKTPLFFAVGLEFDTVCELGIDGIEDLHPEVIIDDETNQIQNLKDLIIAHGDDPFQEIRSKLNKGIQQINSEVQIWPETLCDTMMYAPILYAKKDLSGHKLAAYLFRHYLVNNTRENIVNYSLVTRSLDGQDIYRPFKRTFRVHYMNYIEAKNYTIKSINNEPIYYLNDEGYWVFNKIQIVKKQEDTITEEEPVLGCINDVSNEPIEKVEHMDNVGKFSATKVNDINYVDDSDFIEEGIVEVYFNGEQYQFVYFYKDYESDQYEIDELNKNQLNIDELKIKQQTNDDVIQLRYVFKDGYHFVATDIDEEWEEPGPSEPEEPEPEEPDEIVFEPITPERPCEISGILMFNESPHPNQDVSLYEGDLLVDIRKTDRYGAVNFMIAPHKETTYTIRYNNNVYGTVIKTQEHISTTFELTGTDDVSAYTYPNSIRVENGKLLSDNPRSSRGRAYINQGWNNSEDWDVAFSVNANNQGQSQALVLIKAGIITGMDDQLPISIGFASGGEIYVHDESSNRTTVGKSSYLDLHWTNKTVNIAVKKRGSNYSITFTNANTTEVVQFTSNIFDNYNGSLRLVFTVDPKSGRAHQYLETMELAPGELDYYDCVTINN